MRTLMYPRRFLLLICFFVLASRPAWPDPAESADYTITLTAVTTDIMQLLGVNAGPLPWGSLSNAELTQEYQQIGVKAIRTHDMPGALDMSVMYPDRTKSPSDPSSYDFLTPGDPSLYTTSPVSLYGSDSTFSAVTSGGFEPYFRVGDSAGVIHPPQDSELPNWVSAAVYAVGHYKADNSSGATPWPADSFTRVEIGNEPDSSGF